MSLRIFGCTWSACSWIKSRAFYKDLSTASLGSKGRLEEKLVWRCLGRHHVYHVSFVYTSEDPLPFWNLHISSRKACDFAVEPGVKDFVMSGPEGIMMGLSEQWWWIYSMCAAASCLLLLKCLLVSSSLVVLSDWKWRKRKLIIALRKKFRSLYELLLTVQSVEAKIVTRNISWVYYYH